MLAPFQSFCIYLISHIHLERDFQWLKYSLLQGSSVYTMKSLEITLQIA